MDPLQKYLYLFPGLPYSVIAVLWRLKDFVLLYIQSNNAKMVPQIYSQFEAE